MGSEGLPSMTTKLPFSKGSSSQQGIIHYDTGQRYSLDGQSPVSGICGLNNQTLPLPATLERLVEQLQMYPFRTLKTTKNEGSDVR